MKIIDVHAHYEDEKFKDDLDEVMQKINEKDVCFVINAGAGIDSSMGAICVAQKYSNVCCTIGIHPEFAKNNEKLDVLKKMYEDNKSKIVAIGEIGLDYHYTKENKEAQKQLFKEQLKFAYEVGLPVQIHSRDASIDTIEVLEETKEKPKKIMFHCFDLNAETAKYILKNGYSISVGGNITYKRTNTALNVLKNFPVDKIMTETDSPYLSPASNRGKRNDSSNIKEIIEKLAEIKEMDKELLADRLYNNAIDFYDLKKFLK